MLVSLKLVRLHRLPDLAGSGLEGDPGRVLRPHRDIGRARHARVVGPDPLPPLAAIPVRHEKDQTDRQDVVVRLTVEARDVLKFLGGRGGARPLLPV